MKISGLFLALAAVALLQLSAFGTVLPAGSCVGAGTAACPGTLTVFSDPSLILLASRTDAVTAPTPPIGGVPANFTGVMRSAVYRELSGFLDFYYQFSNNANSADAVQRLTTASFAGFNPIDVGYRTTLPSPNPGPFTTAGTKPPLWADRTADGSIVGWQFFDNATGNLTTKILPGETSAILVIKTNATAFVTGQFTASDGASVSAPSFEPAAAIPEPATNMILGAGLIALACSTRNRRT